ncbi:unnamed protein product [Allacma fusca]|uniref:Uncharacterized protein n=1 Tax=Allacma fusca TaxID=39272 RepID=A0A8J2K0M4_9HEXA|nr:unnamed protein product [Allacma fusca]
MKFWAILFWMALIVSSILAQVAEEPGNDVKVPVEEDSGEITEEDSEKLAEKDSEEITEDDSKDAVEVVIYDHQQNLHRWRLQINSAVILN